MGSNRYVQVEAAVIELYVQDCIFSITDVFTIFVSAYVQC